MLADLICFANAFLPRFGAGLCLKDVMHFSCFLLSLHYMNWEILFAALVMRTIVRSIVKLNDSFLCLSFA